MRILSFLLIDLAFLYRNSNPLQFSKNERKKEVKISLQGFPTRIRVEEQKNTCEQPSCGRCPTLKKKKGGNVASLRIVKWARIVRIYISVYSKKNERFARRRLYILSIYGRICCTFSLHCTEKGDTQDETKELRKKKK